jgi:soluble lytic murein transglycosylase-like protein
VANAESSTSRPAHKSAQASPVALNPCPIPARYREAFEAAARDTHLPIALLVSVARVESNLDHGARSPAGARGLFQLMPPTAAELHLDPDRPASNVLAGARYLKQMLERFDSADLALAAYNAGPGAVEHAGGAPGAETITYVANVNRLWQRLQGCN